MSSVIWIENSVDGPSLQELSHSNLYLQLHPAAVSHLAKVYEESRLPLPRLERHHDYLFGVVYIPSNPTNLSADFDRVTFAATHDRVIATVRPHPTSVLDWSALTVELGAVDSTDTTPDGGQFILNLLRYATEEIYTDAQTIEQFLIANASRILGNVDLTPSISSLQHHETMKQKERRALLKELRAFSTTTTELARIMPRIRRVAEETSVILCSLKDNDPQRDLHADVNGFDRELFSENLEIFIIDTYLDSRKMVATLDEADALLLRFFERAKQLSSEENEAAGRFTGAIASIMLLPTFIVGLYGQNFDNKTGFFPETSWKYGYLYSWGMIVLVTAFQILLFRRRRWL